MNDFEELEKRLRDAALRVLDPWAIIEEAADAIRQLRQERDEAREMYAIEATRQHPR